MPLAGRRRDVASSEVDVGRTMAQSDGVVADTEALGDELEFDDPLAVRVGLYVGADDLPCDGWPESFNRPVVERILSYLPTEDI